MKVRLKRSWAQWSVGHVFTEMPGGQARTLIARGIAEEVGAIALAASSPVFKSPADRAVRSSQMLRKAR
jgi:hypothetical protein